MLFNYRTTARVRTRQAIWCLVLIATSASSEHAQQTTIQVASTPRDAMVAEPQEFPLWENGAPGALGTAESDQPTLTYYSPVYATGTAIVITPGGGYSFVAINHEGRQIANWLNSLGIAAFVVKYRVGPKYHHPIELGDAQRAVRLVRARAAEFRIQPDHVGIMGFSAGGHLAATVATHFDAGNPGASDPIDRVDCRPDFVILGYPVISFIGPYVHRGSVMSLLGDNPDPNVLKGLSDELQVTPQTPPTFLVTTGEDTTVPPENSMAFYQALRKAGVPAELHIFEKGGHGMGLTAAEPKHEVWRTLLEDWLRGRGLLQKYELPPNPDK
jgi:acetyl esterase/lipase